jgi:hypothetical protein
MHLAHTSGLAWLQVHRSEAWGSRVSGRHQSAAIDSGRTPLVLRNQVPQPPSAAHPGGRGGGLGNRVLHARSARAAGSRPGPPALNRAAAPADRDPERLASALARCASRGRPGGVIASAMDPQPIKSIAADARPVRCAVLRLNGRTMQPTHKNDGPERQTQPPPQLSRHILDWHTV